MNITYYPDKESVTAAMEQDEPLLVLNRSGADWTFVRPPDYSKVTRKDKRIEQFFKDGMTIIPKALKSLGYDVPVEIPKRYRRHSDMMGD